MRTPGRFDKLFSWLLIVPAILLGIVIVELFSALLPTGSGGDGADMQMRRIVFLDGHLPIFINHGDIFAYAPHNNVRNVTAFFAADSFKIEYDYRYHTNNLGLVQDGDVRPGAASFLLLGDSFTEGQGAEPWFREIAPEIARRGLQPVNGGVMGTGFLQWLLLEHYLQAQGVRVDKLLVPFISDDYERKVWNFTPDDFRCMTDLESCRFQNSLFYRLPSPEAMSSWVARIRASRANRASRAPTSRHGGLAAWAAAWLPQTYRVYMYFRSGQVEQQSRDAITELIRLNGADRIAFLHLPQKDELATGPNDLGVRARRAIRQAGGQLFDGFELCRMTAADYYPTDEHPNRSGYDKIAACVLQIADGMTRRP